MGSFFSLMDKNPSIDQIADAFAKVEQHPFELGYMQIALHDLRNMVNEMTLREDPPSVRSDLMEFLKNNAALSGDAIAVLTSDNISLLVNDQGQLLSFA